MSEETPPPPPPVDPAPAFNPVADPGSVLVPANADDKNMGMLHACDRSFCARRTAGHQHHWHGRGEQGRDVSVSIDTSAG